MHMLGHFGHQNASHEGHRDATPEVNESQAKARTFETRTCPHCGFQLRDGYAFCPGCGMKLQKDQCPACGQNLEPGWNHCAYCGYPLGKAQEQKV